MSPLARHGQFEHVGRSHHSAAPESEDARRHRRPDVEPDDRVHAVEGAPGDHVLGPRIEARFLGGLEDQPDFSRKIRLHLREDRRDAEKDRRVRVVAARVHHALDRRAKRDVRFLFERQRVDIRADGDARTGKVRIQIRGHSRIPSAEPDPDLLVVHLPERLLDEERRLALLPEEFGIRVKPSAVRNDVRCYRFRHSAECLKIHRTVHLVFTG